jgi:2-polyprenyl-3-methyl-5-hydroxy-6-metoxy-1,4-benzoquinol methylase
MTESAACRDCGAAGTVVYTGLRDRHFGVDGAWRVLGCSACDRLWLDPAPDAEALDATYSEYYTHEGAATGGFEPWLKRAVPAARLGYGACVGTLSRIGGRALSWIGPLRTIGERAVLWLVPRNGGRLLDVGCGSGELLVRMRDLGWKVAGVELDARAARVARARSGATVAGSLVELDAAAFDAVVLDHVLEHLPDARSTLGACARVLRPGGRLAIATPNPASAGRARFGASWLHWDPPRHLELRGEQALRRLVEESGFEIDRIFTCAGSAHFVWSASRVIERDGALPGIRVEGLSLRERLEAIRFWLTEHARTSRGTPCGEEWIVLATRGGTTAGGNEA